MPRAKDCAFTKSANAPPDIFFAPNLANHGNKKNPAANESNTAIGNEYNPVCVKVTGHKNEGSAHESDKATYTKANESKNK